MAEAAIQHCRSYALEAERKMGQMLAATERAKGELKRGPVVTPRNHGESPTLSSLGISKRESSEAQSLAAMPQTTFDEIKSGEKTRTEVRREMQRAAVIERIAEIGVTKNESAKAQALAAVPRKEASRGYETRLALATARWQIKDTVFVSGCKLSF